MAWTETGALSTAKAPSRAAWHPRPTYSLSELDLFALMVAENAVAQYEGTPLHAHLRTAFDKLLSLLPGEARDAHALTARASRRMLLPSAIVFGF